MITGQDIPDVRFGNGAVKDRRVFALDKVRYIGEPVAAVAAVDEITALEALDLIEVTYEDLPAVTDPIAAFKPDAPLVHEDLPTYDGYAASMGGNICTVLDSDRGDVDAAFAQADHVFEDTFRSQGIHQGYLEAMACVANVDPSGRIHVWTSTQGPYQVRASLAAVLQAHGSPAHHPYGLGGALGPNCGSVWSLSGVPGPEDRQTSENHRHAGRDVHALRLSSPHHHLFEDRGAARMAPSWPARRSVSSIWAPTWGPASSPG